jgi:hypothetical protein
MDAFRMGEIVFPYNPHQEGLTMAGEIGLTVPTHLSKFNDLTLSPVLTLLFSAALLV